MTREFIGIKEQTLGDGSRCQTRTESRLLIKPSSNFVHHSLSSLIHQMAEVSCANTSGQRYIPFQENDGVEPDW